MVIYYQYYTQNIKLASIFDINTQLLQYYCITSLAGMFIHTK